MTYFNDPAIPRFEHPDFYDAEMVSCAVCSEPHYEGEVCENCYCGECGEELPDEVDAHCTNCCECDACYEAYCAVKKIADATGEWQDIPVITGEKVFSKQQLMGGFKSPPFQKT